MPSEGSQNLNPCFQCKMKDFPKMYRKQTVRFYSVPSRILFILSALEYGTYSSETININRKTCVRKCSIYQGRSQEHFPIVWLRISNKYTSIALIACEGPSTLLPFYTFPHIAATEPGEQHRDSTVQILCHFAIVCTVSHFIMFSGVVFSFCKNLHSICEQIFLYHYYSPTQAKEC